MNIRLDKWAFTTILGLIVAARLCFASQDVSIVSPFPPVPGQFKAFDDVGRGLGIGQKGVAYRFYLASLTGERTQTFLAATFKPTDTLYRGHLDCNVEWQVYRAGRFAGNRTVQLPPEDAVSFLNAIDKSEIFSICAAQQARRMPISGRLVTAEQVDKNGKLIVDRCERSSAPMEYIVNYLRSHFSDDL